MTDNKQAYGWVAGTAAPPAYPQQAGMGNDMGMGMGMGGGGFPQTQFAGPAYGVVGGGYGPPGGYGPQGGYGGPAAGIENPGYGMGGPGPAMMGAAYAGMRDPEGPKPYSNESGSSFGDNAALEFSDRTIRMAFIRKVYGILGMQMLLTTAIIALFCLHRPTKLWVQQTPAFTFASYGIALVLMIALVCCENARRKSPTNMILLALFTLTEGIVVGAVSSTYNVESVVIAAGVTVVICFGLTLFSFQTKYDFTMMGGSLFCVLLVFTLFGFLAMFVRIPAVHMVLAGVGALIFSVYLVYDTQLMIGGNHKMSISPEEYVFAALNIYMDVIMIFLYILRLLGSRE